MNDEHRRLVPYCKMVRGTETTDVPLTFTRIQNSSLLTKEPTDPDFNKMVIVNVTIYLNDCIMRLGHVVVLHSML